MYLTYHAWCSHGRATGTRAVGRAELYDYLRESEGERERERVREYDIAAIFISSLTPSNPLPLVRKHPLSTLLIQRYCLSFFVEYLLIENSFPFS